MKEKYCKIPKFRFNKFIESWERLKYEDVIEVNSGKDYKHLDKGDIPVYGTGGYMLSVSEAITNKDGVGIGRKGTINKPYILKAPYWTVDTLFFCIPKNKYNLYFINAIFERTQWERFDESTGVPSLSKLTINNIQNYFPSFDEQSAIGSLFLTLDDLLASYKDNLANYQSLKATMLTKMFPKTGQTVPEIRLDGFDGEWKKSKLKDVAHRVQGNDGRMDLPTLTISASGGWMNQIDRFSANIAGKEQKNYTLLKKGELSYNHGNSKLAKYGVVFELQEYEEALVPKVYHSFRVNQLVDAKFIEIMFSTKIPDRELGKLVSSGARMDGLLNISFDDFMNIAIIIPTIAEQQAIGSYFSNLDNLITSHQEKISQIETLKKKLLQDMFI